MSLIGVELPAPFGPRNPVAVPGSTVNDTSSTAVTCPYRLVNPCATVILSVPSHVQHHRGAGRVFRIVEAR
jgi:hypothetical protein